MTHFYIFTNSPGEVFSWVKPITESLATLPEDIEITVFLTPCQYATGQEYRVCQSFPNVRHVYLPKETFITVMLKKADFQPGYVFYLGGDPSYPQRFAKKTDSKLLAYAEKKFPDQDFDLVVYQSRINNLMVSNLVVTPEYEKKGLCLLPGSRPEHLDVALPIMSDIVSKIKDIPITVILSPFTPDEKVERIKANYQHLTIKRLESPNELTAFKFALTIPGTNTMQLAFFNIPFLMILPTHQAKILRLDGIPGLLLLIPFIGTILKYIFLRVMERQNKLYALPNILLGNQICPELVGRFTIDKAQQTLRKLLNDRHGYNEIIQKFKTIKQSTNVANYFSDWVSRNPLI